MKGHYDSFRYHKAAQEVLNFITTDVSALYCQIIKDRRVTFFSCLGWTSLSVVDPQTRHQGRAPKIKIIESLFFVHPQTAALKNDNNEIKKNNIFVLPATSKYADCLFSQVHNIFN